jgi:hypothetical protein
MTLFGTCRPQVTRDDGGTRRNLRADTAHHHLQQHQQGHPDFERHHFRLSSGICTNRMDDAMRFGPELKVGTVNMWEVPGYRFEFTPFGGIKDSELGYKEGVQEAMKWFCNGKTSSFPE